LNDEALTKMIQISAIVCTYNRADMLEKAMESLARQTLDPAFYEIIIVDNASTDATSRIVSNFKNSHKRLNIDFIGEARMGLGYARNTGFRQARGEYVAFMDDDARADKIWLVHALEVMAQIKPAVLGGPVYPFYNSSKPVWFKDEYEMRGTSRSTGPIKEGEYFSGTNMIFLRDLLIQLDGFDERLGMKADRLGYGEETAFIIKAGRFLPDCRMYFDSDLIMYHLVPGHKMSLGWRVKSNFISGRQSETIFNGLEEYKPFSLPMAVFSFLKDSLLLFMFTLYGAIFRSRVKYPFFQNYFFEKVKGYFFYLGRDWQSFQSVMGKGYS